MNFDTLYYLNLFLGSGAIILQVFSVVALFLLFFPFKENKKNFYLDFIDKHFLVLSFFISLFASIFPLVYSEIANFLPCYLCWWQRIFMFPLVLMFGVALWDKDRKVIRYAMPLLCVGFLLSAYQNFFYYFGQNSNLPCDASGVSCYQRLVSVFGGYISIPMLALTAFLSLLTILSVAHFYRKEI
ncbi:MAG: disulfide bond formation protein B [Minisyncoccia bacterium]